MDKFTDQDTLRNDQYRDESKLRARIQLHKHFSTNPYSWFLWAYDRFNLPPECTLLELGCGPGDLWMENRDRIPQGWQITLTDFSPGMMKKAAKTLRGHPHTFHFATADAQDIPFPSRAFDAVVANHMFFHVPDRQKSLAEIQRVLRPSGLFYAATVGEKHMQELPDLVSRFDPQLAGALDQERNEFTLESGYRQLREWFSEVNIHRQENNLRITEPEPLVDYILSSFRLGVRDDRREELQQFIESELARRGGTLHILKDNGMLVATRA